MEDTSPRPKLKTFTTLEGVFAELKRDFILKFPPLEVGASSDSPVDEIQIQLLSEWKDKWAAGRFWQFRARIILRHKGIELYVDSASSMVKAIAKLGWLWYIWGERQMDQNPSDPHRCQHDMDELDMRSCAHPGCRTHPTHLYHLHKLAAPIEPSGQRILNLRGFCLQHSRRGDQVSTSDHDELYKLIWKAPEPARPDYDPLYDI